MVDGLIVLAAGILAALALASFAAISANIVGVPAGVLTIAGSVLACIWLSKVADRRKAKAERALAVKDDKRFNELSEHVRSPGYELSITGSSSLLVGVLLALCSGAAFFNAFADSSVVALTLGLILFCFAALVLLAAVPALGKPAIILSASGFRTPHSPFVPWEKVDGIFLQQIMSHGRVVSTILMFRIPALASEIGQYSLVIRLLQPFRKGGGKERLGAVLKNTSESPTVAYRLARLLWTARTGLQHDWNPNMSDGFNEGLRLLK